jgi:hypothetical protein
MVPIDIIPDDDKKGFTVVNSTGDVEFVDPVQLYRDTTISNNAVLYRVMLSTKNPGFPPSSFEPVIQRHAEQSWKELEEEIRATPVPGALWAILDADKKSYQEKLLRSVRFTPFMLAAFLFRAHDEKGYTYSKYTSEFLPTDMDPGDMPVLATIKDGEVTKVGETTLTDGQIKKAIEDRSGIVAHFLDKGEEWHCLFTTIESIAGKENWQGGQPHFHYISSKFGIPREEVVAQVKSRDYKLFGLPHIPLDGYRDDKSPAQPPDPG